MYPLYIFKLDIVYEGTGVRGYKGTGVRVGGGERGEEGRGEGDTGGYAGMVRRYGTRVWYEGMVRGYGTRVWYQGMVPGVNPSLMNYESQRGKGCSGRGGEIRLIRRDPRFSCLCVCGGGGGSLNVREWYQGMVPGYEGTTERGNEDARVYGYEGLVRGYESMEIGYEGMRV